MTRVLKAILVSCAAAVLAACGTTQSTIFSSVGERESAMASPSPTLAGTPAQATEFASRRYGYSLTLPAGWVGGQAFRTWDGTGAPGYDGLSVDRFSAPAGQLTVWAYAAPFDGSLSEWTAAAVRAAATDHPCPTQPATNEELLIGKEAARLLGSHCPPVGGLFVMTAVTVHGATGFVFAVQDPSRATSDEAVRSAFLELITTVQFSGS
ncbi:MAG TPA: hypothetical protein VHU77_03820 [Candidatus Limnocylindria bacterium]|jgi:hypothetical protein|nr:hypothetical protein [Candidatus Limnocylindria bacterium]